LFLEGESDESSRNSRFQLKNGARGNFTVIGQTVGGEAVAAKLTERGAFPFRSINNIDNISTSASSIT
jgi:hypothetical protein